MGKAKKNILSDYIPGQMNISQYLDQISVSEEEKNRIRRDTTMELYCFEADVNIQVSKKMPNSHKIIREDDNGYVLARPSINDNDKGSNLLHISKSSESRQEKAKIFVLTDRESDYQVAEICIGGRFHEVDAINRLLTKLGVCPGKICITHVTQNFTPAVFQKAFIHCGIQVTTELSSKTPDLASRIRSALRTAVSFFGSVVTECEKEHNDDIPEYLWNSRTPYLSPLPQKLFHYEEVYHVRPECNYHVKVLKHFYSIPSEYRDLYREDKTQLLTAIVTSRYVEIRTLDGVTICVHDYVENCPIPYTTDSSHMPHPNDVPYDNYNAYRFLCWANHIGINVRKLCKYYLDFGTCEMQGYLSCMNVLNLDTKYHNVLDRACEEEMACARNLGRFPTSSRIRERCRNLSETDADQPIYKPW